MPTKQINQKTISEIKQEAKIKALALREEIKFHRIAIDSIQNELREKKSRLDRLCAVMGDNTLSDDAEIFWP